MERFNLYGMIPDGELKRRRGFCVWYKFLRSNYNLYLKFRIRYNTISQVGMS